MAISYDIDFVGWTQEQAAILRALPARSGLDTEKLAEEIEASGREAVKELSTQLRIVFTNILTLANSASVVGGTGAVEGAQSEAIFAAENGVERHIDLDDIWQLAEREARIQLDASGYLLPALTESCPFLLNQLFAVDFDVNETVQRVRSEIEQQRLENNRPNMLF